MRRDFMRIVLLSAGVLLGFGSGFHSLRMRSWERRMALGAPTWPVSAPERGAGNPRRADRPPLLFAPGDEPGAIDCATGHVRSQCCIDDDRWLR